MQRETAVKFFRESLHETFNFFFLFINSKNIAIIKNANFCMNCCNNWRKTNEYEWFLIKTFFGQHNSYDLYYFFSSIFIFVNYNFALNIVILTVALFNAWAVANKYTDKIVDIYTDLWVMNSSFTTHHHQPILSSFIIYCIYIFFIISQHDCFGNHFEIVSIYYQYKIMLYINSDKATLNKHAKV